MELFNTNNQEIGEAALQILSTLSLYAGENFVDHSPTIKTILEKCLEKGNPKTKTLAIKCLSSLVATLPPKVAKTYFPFSVPVLLICNDFAFNQQNLEETTELLVSFSEIIETEPRFFKAAFEDLTDLMIKINNSPDIEIGIKQQSVEIVISMSQRYSEVLKTNTGLLKKIIEMVFRHMIDISDEVSEEWRSPPDGFDEELNEDDDQSVVKFAVSCINRLIMYVGSETMLQLLSDCSKTLLAENNLTEESWKMKHAAIMSLSQVGEHMKDPQDVAPIITTVSQNIQHKHPRVRYACCHCLGQLCNDMAPDFQILYLVDVLPMVAKVLQDEVPRVTAHACACLANLFEHCKTPETQVKPFIHDLYAKLWELIKNGTTFLKENALSALSALSVGASKKYFSEFYDNNMEQLLQIIEADSQHQEYRKLVGHAIECATISSKMVGKDRFVKWCDRLFEDMLELQNHIISSEDLNGEDPDLRYLLAGWQRMSMTLGKDFQPYVDKMMPNLLQLCEEIIKSGRKFEEDEVIGEGMEGPEGGDERLGQVNSVEEDNCFVVVNMIRLFLKKCTTAMHGWIEPIYEVVLSLMRYQPNDTVRTTASRCLSYIILAMRGVDPEEKVLEFARTAVQELWAVMEEETDLQNQYLHCKAMQKIIKKAGRFLDENQLQAAYLKCVEFINESQERRQQIDEAKNEEEEDEEETQNALDVEKEMEDEFCCHIAEIIGWLLQTHKEQGLGIARDVNEKFVAQNLEDGSPTRMKKFALYLICDITEHLGGFEEIRKAYFEVIQALWFNFYPISQKCLSKTKSSFLV